MLAPDNRTARAGVRPLDGILVVALEQALSEARSRAESEQRRVETLEEELRGGGRQPGSSAELMRVQQEVQQQTRSLAERTAALASVPVRDKTLTVFFDLDETLVDARSSSSIVVRPSANVAAAITLAVPVTVLPNSAFSRRRYFSTTPSR